MALQDILKGSAAYLAQKAKDAIEWYKSTILKIGKSSSIKDPDNVFKKKSYPELGKMYIYTYNPLTREKLPFFDMYPLTIPLNYYNGPHGPGFLGINLHYLPPLARLNLLRQLYDVRTNTAMDDTTRLNVTYRLLNQNQGKYAGYEQCVKRYLFGHVVSSFHEINPNDWEHVVQLPLQRWIVNPKKPRKPPY